MTRLKIAIPSKGRLKEKSEAFFADCGFRLRQKGGDRAYRASLSGLDTAEVLLLSAREIAQGLIDGEFHCGITGEDLLHDLSETPGEDAQVLKRLGFGFADVVVAVPKAWLDVSTMVDLEAAAALFRDRHGRRMKVATKYMRLTRRFFAAQSVGDYRLVYSAGATEAAPSSGAADLIVDITTTGATLTANGLKVLDDGVILKSQAALTASRFADWSDEVQQAFKGLLSPIEARGLADRTVLLTTAMSAPPTLLEELGLSTHSERTYKCAPSEASHSAQKLTDSGCGPVTINQPDFLFGADANLFESFIAKL